MTMAADDDGCQTEIDEYYKTAFFGFHCHRQQEQIL